MQGEGLNATVQAIEDLNVINIFVKSNSLAPILYYSGPSVIELAQIASQLERRKIVTENDLVVEGPFDGKKFYRPADERLRILGSRSTLARWRTQGEGPPFVKLGNSVSSRVIYAGSALNDWLRQRRIGAVDCAA